MAALAFLNQPQDHPQVVGDLLEHARVHPAPDLLIGDRPLREVVRQHSPLTSGLHYVADGVEHLAQVVRSLRGVRISVRYGDQELPFRIRDITRIRLPCRFHPLK